MPGESLVTKTYYLDAETSSVCSVFIARGYLRSNAQNRHPFHHQPKVECITKSSQQSFAIDGKICIIIQQICNIKIETNMLFVVRIITSKQQILSVRSSPDPPIFKKIAVWSSPDPVKIGFSPDPTLIPWSSLVYRIRILESNPAEYYKFFGFGLDFISLPLQPDSEPFIQMK